MEKIGRVSTASVHKATGKHWDEWLAILDKAGAATWTHGEIASWLKKRYRLRPWWQQGVAIGFELARGKRIEGQNSAGEYSLTVTKSLHKDAKAAWTFFLSESGQAVWLKPLFEVKLRPKSQFETEDGYFGEVRTMKVTGRVRKVRILWNEPEWQGHTFVEILLIERPAGKDKKGRSLLVITHGRIKDLRVQLRLRKRWREAADLLASMI